MPRLLIAAISVLGVLCPLGCDSSHCPEEPSDDGDVSNSLDPIEGKIRFRVKERHAWPYENCDPSIFLIMETEKHYGCCNYVLESDIGIRSGALSVDLLGIFKPSMCIPTFGPACSHTPLQLKPSEYALSFFWDGDVDEYQLIVTDSSLCVSGGDSSLAAPDCDLVWRYPRGSFACRCSVEEEHSWVCGAFIDSLLASGRFESFEFPDSGAIPYGCDCPCKGYDMPAGYFRYQEEGDYDIAGEILRLYVHEVLPAYPNARIRLTNWRNKSFLSWHLDEGEQTP